MIRAVTRIMPLHVGKGKSAKQAIKAIIKYVENPDKTDEGQLITCYQCDAKLADAQFALSKEIYKKQTGRVQGKDDVIAYHFRQSFLPGEVTAEEANQIGQEFARRFTNGNYAYIVCTHIDRHHIHNHIIWNSTSLDCIKKFRNFWGSTEASRRLNDQIGIEHGISIVDHPEKHGLAYNKWSDGKTKIPTLRDELRAEIDHVLEQKPKDMEEFFELLTQDGYKLKYGKELSIKGGRQKKYIRLSSLGREYSLDVLQKVIAGQHKHPEQPKIIVIQKVGLLIDIQQKINEGKSGGYQQWASVFNAKQLAQTYNYLRAYNLLDKADLDAKANRLTEKYHDIQNKMDALDQKISEKTELKKQIIAYNRTRSTFEKYKASGYSKAFFAEHKDEIEQHRTAKRFFNEQNLEKLPSIKSLQDEIGQLLTEKKSMYGEYKTTREEMKEVLNVQENVNRIFEISGQELHRENEHGR